MPPPKKQSAASTQEFLPIEAMREGVVVLKGNQGMRAILMVSSLNFALKSEEEQDALVFQYENFLNALDFPLQIVVQSRRLNIRPYLEVLAGRQKEETNELLKVQIGEYAEFIKSFVDLSNIVSKTFFVIVPFTPSVAERHGGILKRLAPFFGGRGSSAPASADDQFEQSKAQLLQRVDAVSSGLRRLGLRVVQINTEELVELFYGLYNPGESQRAAEREEQTSLSP